MEKVKCWDFLKCGREVDGGCPVPVESRLDGVNGGKNAGRVCWIIEGTFCRDEVQGTFIQKFSTCKECDFFKLVGSEEGHELVFDMNI